MKLSLEASKAHAELTPTMRGVLERMRRAQPQALHTMSPQAAREAYALRSGVLEVASPPLAREQRLSIPARDGSSLNALLLAPSGAALPVLVYFHGGGFTIGSSATHQVLCREIARLAGCAVVSVDYRLAPEHRFPTAVHDSFDALQWVHRHRSALGLLPEVAPAVGGDSAGGTLAAVCALMARDAGLALALQLLIYPGTTAHQDTPTHQRYAQGFLLESASISWFFDQYIERDQREHWWFAPLNVPDVQGVAPAWVGLAECDPLFDEGVAYADRLRLEHVPVTLEVYRGVVHEFVKMGRAIPQARQAHRDMALALRQAWGLPEHSLVP